MQFQIASDLHHEFNKDDGLIAQCDTLILAGDIVPFYSKFNLMETYRRLKKKFKTIIHVPGNHEYYCKRSGPHHKMSDLITSAREVANAEGVILLDNQIFDIGSVRIIGSTLWSHIAHESATQIAQEMNDYQCIFSRDNRGLLTVDDTNALHATAVEFIRSAGATAIEDGQVPLVVTHHAPQVIGTSDPRYAGTIRNTAFATDLQHLFSGVHTWVFGHTHFACDFIDKESGARIVSNPKGYPGERVAFRRQMIIEL